MAGTVATFHSARPSEAVRSLDDTVSSDSLSKTSARPTVSREAPPGSASFSSSTLHPNAASPAPSSVIGQLSRPTPRKTPSLSSRSSSGSSSGETSAAPSTPTANPAASRRADRQSTTRPHARYTPLTALRRQQPAKAASSVSSANVKMLVDDNVSLPPVGVSAATSTGSKTNHILGPDGQLYTQGEAAKLGLTIRTACEACRNRKLKCSGTLPENGGCGRCNSDGIQCVYSARAPIGRPKKRKVEDASNSKTASTSNSPAPSAKGKAKRSHSASNSLSHIATRIKTEETTPLNSPRIGSDMFSLTSSPAFQHLQSSSFLPERPSLPATPAQSEHVQQHTTPHDVSPAGFVAPHPFNLYESPMQAPQAPNSNASSSRLVSTPTIWSQNPVAFAMTPSDTTTPHSVISYTDTQQISQQPAPQASTSASAVKLPSLDDLSVAAFLQSLDTLEISPAELFQHQQLQHHMQPLSGATSGSGTPAAVNAYRLGTPFDDHGYSAMTAADHLDASSVEEWATSSAILQPGLSFAVPADFSWWDLGLKGADFGVGSAAASASATPSSTELGSMVMTSSSIVQPRMPVASGSRGQNSSSSGSSTVVDSASANAHASSAAAHSQSSKSRRPTFNADQLWPRGADAGMGQGQIQHTVAASETGLGWSTLPGPSHLAEALSSPVESPVEGRPGNAGEHGSCCSSKFAKTASLSPAEIRDDRTAQTGKEKASCCSSKAKAETASVEIQKPASCCADKGANDSTHVHKSASCCAGKGDKESTDSEQKPPVSKEAPKSCCSGHDASTSSSTSSERKAPEKPIEMGPLSTSAAVHGKGLPRLDSERKRHAALHAHHPSKVHCVPNPSGKGCTCLCDMSVALLSVKQVLRETDPHKASDASTSFATDTIQLTLTASQAITAQCACSADCPTCQSDPSTEISASLLVSTALQIYARAVRILREGFSSGEGASVQSFFGGLDVTIGTYKPSASNAKRIALYAVKLELKDLRKALGKVSRMAQNFGVARSERKEGEAEGEKQGMNPIDQLVILKLYRQLTELLKTIEGLEDAA